MGANAYCLELMFILLNIFQPYKLMKKKNVDTDLIFEENRKKALEKNLVVNLLELIQVSVMIKTIKLVEYKHLSVKLKTDN